MGLEPNARHVVWDARLHKRAVVGLNHWVHLIRAMLVPKNLPSLLLCAALPLIVHGLVGGLIGTLQTNGPPICLDAVEAVVLACIAGP